MYFLYLLILCHTSILFTPVNTYVVLAANLNDFRNLAKKYVPKNLVGQIKAMILENGHKYYKEPSNDDEEVDGTVEYFNDGQQDDSYEVIKEFKTKHEPVNIYQMKRAPKAAFAEPSPHIASLGTSTVLTIDDIVEKVKQRLFQQILDKSVNAQAKPLSALTGDSLAYRNFLKKPIKSTETKAQVENPVYKTVPMKVIKEEVQFEATYEDALDTDKKPGQVGQNPVQYLHNKRVTDNSYIKNVSPKNRFVNTQHGGGVKTVRFIKQVLVPANSDQGQSANIPQPSMVLQPMQQVSLGQQPSVQHSNLEPQLSLMQLPSIEPKYLQLHNQVNNQQATIMEQLVLMQQQIEQLNRTAQQTELKKKRLKQQTSLTVEGIPKLNIEAVETSFEIVPDQPVDEQKTNEGNAEQIEPSIAEADESVLSEETTITPVTETSTKALTVPGAVENEQFTEENEVVQDFAATAENEVDAQEKTPEEIVSKGKGITPDPETGKDTKLVENVKVHTQEFGNLDAGEPIVAKTYNFDGPNVEAVREPVNLNLPVDSARKVMLL